MIVEEITLSGWRSYRELHTFRFDEKVNLLIGPNAAGKSTLLEALQRGLFDRHNGTSEEIKAVQPAETSLAPEVTVTFRSNGGRFRIHKRFLREASSELQQETAGVFRRVADGDAADERTLSMAGGSFPGRGASKPVHRGLAEALWYLQREPPIPEREWNEGVRRGLAGVIHIALRSPLEEEVVDRVQEAHDQSFTPTGREKKGVSRGELVTARERVTQLGIEIGGLRQKLDTARNARESLERLEIEREEKGRELAERKAELEAEKKLLQESGEVGQAKAKAESAHQKAMEKLVQLEGVFKTLDAKRAEIASLVRKHQQLTDLHGANQSELAAEEAAAARALHQRTEVKVPELQGIEAELEQLQSLERLRTLAKSIERLEAFVGRQKTARRDFEEKTTALTQLKAPSKSEIEKFQALTTEIQVKEAEARATSIRVGIDFQRKGMKVSSKPILDRDGEEYLVVEPTTFELEGIARIRVRGLGESLQGIQERLAELRKEVSSTLSKFAAKDTGALAAAIAQREALEGEVKAARRKVKDLSDEEPGAEAELLKCRRGAEEENTRITSLSAEAKGWGGEKIRAVASELRLRKRECIGEIENLEAEEKRAGSRVQTLLRGSGTTRAELSKVSATRDQLQHEVESVLETYGSRAHLESAVSAAKGESETRRLGLEQKTKEYNDKVLAPQQRMDAAEKAATSLTERVGKIDMERAGHEKEIELLTREGIYTAEADSHAELEYLNARVLVLENRAEAIKLLKEVLDTCQETRTQALTLPIREILNPWFKDLTGGAYEEVEIGTDLLPLHAVQNGGTKIPAGWMSFGTHEQLIVLVRLAMGMLASRAERQAIVLDDRLVNADPVRARRLATIIREAGERAQIVLTTCNDGAYAGIEASIIRVPDDGANAEARTDHLPRDVG